MKARHARVWLNIALAVMLSLGLMSGAAASDDSQNGSEKRTSSDEDVMHVTLRASLVSPLFSEFPVATVNDEAISLEELKQSLTFSHSKGKEGDNSAPKVDFSVFLDRLITIRLFTQEAKRIGIDELPEVRSNLDNFSAITLRQMYVAGLVKDLKADDSEVEPLYQENVREWKLCSVVFSKEEDAQAVVKLIAEGKNFGEAAGQAVKDGLAKGSADSSYVRVKTLNPRIVETLSKIETGTVSTVIPVGEGKARGYTLVMREDERFAEDAKEREKIQKQIYDEKRQKFLEQYKKNLYKKFARVDRKLLASIDYESNKPGMEKLLNDKRVLVRISGEPPIRVSDLTAELQEAFYHGADVAKKSRKINKEKQYTLENVMDRVLLKREALKKGLQNTAEFKSVVREYETSVLFGLFIGKVIASEVKVTDEEKRSYYERNQAQFMTAISMRLSSLVFETKKYAEEAMAKLQKNADFSWVRENAEGQLKREASIPAMSSQLVVLHDLPAELQTALKDVETGGVRIAETGDGWHVFSAEEVIPSRVIPYDDVASYIERNVSGANLDKVAHEWKDRLRKSSEVRIFLAAANN